MIRLSAKNTARCYFLNRKKLKSAVTFILKKIGIDDAELSIVFTTDSGIKRLNSLYRGQNRPTDVLAFSMREGKPLKKDSLILGDIAISVDRAREQAKRFKSSFKKEIYLYIIHGLLHLTGYDDRTRSAEKQMREKETAILNYLWKRKEK
ncbi:MAG: rRNA maturation RNase YbeY [Candidatus Omnitrophota bacterium]|nr:rRNA maturation RNase YbeY [Candidatus Omnitrophota bacterium]